MAMLHGKGGHMTFGVLGGAGTESEISSWSVDATADVADVTNMNSDGDWKEYLAGFRGWTASCETVWNATNLTTTAIIPLLGGTTTALKMEFVDAAGHLAGDAILTGMSVNTDANDAVKITYNFQGTGAIAYAAA